ncbi:hypothetical protein PEL8287_03740 [Roseovarius litorisediminis]|uniref:Protein ImuA n=1 Tax=Roseovarius litorisediminis TaxID=1312363 RepID=A0A1Y5TMU8_9RHOB|nr:hypothetical protein [Roseovarius litorisediminis]SLN67581.1 hypothetical protein PEL8287_03740 [Roseovarius litorisediminis]
MQSDLSTSFPLRRARVHEVCGSGAMGFAAVCVAQMQGDVLWIREVWRPEALNPVGLNAFFDPARMLVAQVKDQTEGLAVAEEALRDGALPLVVVELSQPLDLTKGRRLQLAAKIGKSTGLCLIPEGMGSNAAETRWQCTPFFNPAFDPADSTLQRWEIIKNKSGTLRAWHVRWDAASRRLHVVSPAGKRPGSQDAPD